MAKYLDNTAGRPGQQKEWFGQDSFTNAIMRILATPNVGFMPVNCRFFQQEILLLSFLLMKTTECLLFFIPHCAKLVFPQGALWLERWDGEYCVLSSLTHKGVSVLHISAFPPLPSGALPQTFQWGNSCFFSFIFVKGSTPGISSQHFTAITPYLKWFLMFALTETCTCPEDYSKSNFL